MKFGGLCDSLYELVAADAQANPEAPAVKAPGRPSLSYRQLTRQLMHTAGVLRRQGVRRGDRVAVVLPNGPEMAVSFLGVATAATCAPLNPSYREAEFDFYFADLQPRFLITTPGLDSCCRQAAAKRGVPVLELSVDASSLAGEFQLGGAQEADCPDPARGDDVALILHTSGTTSRPKMVPLSHANLCASAQHIRTSLALTSEDCCLNVMPLFHIHGLIASVLASLSAGGSVVCTPGFLAPSFFDWLEEFSPSWYTAVPTMHQSILARAAANSRIIARRSLRFIRSSSAPLPPRVMADLEQTFGVPVVEAYGMTEASHQMACNPLPPRTRKPGSVGIAAGPDIAVMTEAGELLVSGPGGTTVGEVVIRGPNVTAGYANNPEANQVGYRDGWFRTGDQGRLDAEGYLYLTGRNKEIINRGGEKVSPREVDEVLLEHPAVQQAIAFAIPDPKLGEEVGAAVVLREAMAASELELRQFVAGRLADFKIPKKIVFTPEIPKGPTGKLQRIGLAQKLGLEAEPTLAAAAEYVAPRTRTEILLARIWGRVLRLDRVGVHDDFFACGGDSLLAAQMLMRLRGATGRNVPLLMLFTHSTVSRLAAYLDSAEDLPSLPPLAPAQREGDFPPSFAQQRMWFLAQYEPDAAVYVRPLAFRMEGEVDEAALERALREIVRRHEVLRTTYHMQPDGLVQRVDPGATLPWRVTHIDAAPDSSPLTQLNRISRRELESPFDLSRDIPLRAVLIRHTDTENYLLLILHHIGSDGWSKGIFAREIGSLYSDYSHGLPSSLPELRIQYGDFAEWESKVLQNQLMQRQLSYWVRQLEGHPPVLPLPLDHPRPARQTFAAASVSTRIPPDLTDALKHLCRQERVTLFMGLLAVFQILLSRYSCCEDVVVGCPIANRASEDAEALIGILVNTLALRTHLGGDPQFRELLARVRNTALAAYENQDVPFAAVVEAIRPKRSVSHSPVYQVLFQLRNFPTRNIETDTLKFTEVALERWIAAFELELEATEVDSGIDLNLMYHRECFEPSTAARILESYLALLRAACQKPDHRINSLPLLSDSERRKVLEEWNRTGQAYSAACLPQLFEEQVRRGPERLAVSCRGRTLTYRELNEDANRVAHALRDRGLGRGAVVGIALERSERMLGALLGVMKAGAAYLPLDPHYPADRLKFMLRDSGARLVLVDRSSERLFEETGVETALLESFAGRSREDFPAVPEPSDVAYILYTSGSTGLPKGIAIPYRAVVNLLESVTALIGASADGSWLAVTTISFDIAVPELFLPLLTGAQVEIAPRDVTGDGYGLRLLLERCDAAFMGATPSTWRMLMESGWQGSSRLVALCSGEAMTPDFAAELRPKVARLWNFYGPTETTVWSSAFEVPLEAAGISIGRPLSNTQLYVLDRNLQPVPPGVTGELYIGGEGLAVGYLNRPELTAERFIPNPFVDHPDCRIYRTGDLARFLDDGSVYYLGRTDDQVKLRGFRVELGEIEAVLGRHPDLSSVAVVLNERAAEDRQIVAYFVAGARPPAPSELRGFLKQSLPDYMLPSFFVPLDRLPLAPNGKVDRKSLAARPVRPAGESQAAAPQDPVEARLAAMCEDLLDVRPVSVTADLFDLGAHSLLLAKLLGRIEKEFQQRIPLPALFELPTVRHLASFLRGEAPVDPRPKLVPLRRAGSKPPLFWIKADPLFRELVLRLPEDQPVNGLYLPEDHPLPLPYSIEQVAAYHLQTLCERQPHGPYHLGGFCVAGLVAYEMACRLRESGEEMGLLILLDTHNPAAPSRWELVDWSRRQAAQIKSLGPRGYVNAKSEAARTNIQRLLWERRYAQGGRDAARALLTVENAEFQALRYAAGRYTPRAFDGLTLLLRRGDERIRPVDPQLGWHALLSSLQVQEVPGGHISMFAEPRVGFLARAIGESLAKAQRSAGPW